MAYHDPRFPSHGTEAPPRTDAQGPDPIARGELKPTDAPADVRPCQPEGRLYE